MCLFVLIGALVLCIYHIRVGVPKDSKDNMEADSVREVLSSPQLLGHIFEFSDMETLMIARNVNRHWRSLSEVYLKRRMSICHHGVNMGLIAPTGPVQELDLFNMFQLPPPPGDFGLTVRNTDSTEFGSTSYCPSLCAMIFELEWLWTIKMLNLHQSLTVDDWLVAGNAILKKMTSLTTLLIEFRAERSAVVPLYFTELKKNHNGDGAHTALKLVDFRFRLCTFEDPTRCDQILDGVFECTKLATFKLNIMNVLDAWVTRSTEPQKLNAEIEQEWQEAGFRIHDEIPFSSTLARFLAVMLNKTQPLKLDIPYDFDALSLFVKNSYTISHLKNTLQRTDTGGLPLSVLKWWWSNYKTEISFNSKQSPVYDQRTSALPNVRWLQLNRSKDTEVSAAIDDKWICSNLHKALPNVDRLVVNVYNPVERGSTTNYRDDINRVVEIVQSFRGLKHLVLINDQLPGTAVCTRSRSVLSCFKRLETLTLSIVDPKILSNYAKFALVAANLEHSITELGFFRRDIRVEEPAGAVLVDLDQLGVAAPGHPVVVRTGAWTRQRAEEAGEKLDESM